MDELTAREKLQKEGFVALKTTNSEPNYYFGRHTHDLKTVQIVLNGQLIIEKGGIKKILRAGDRIEFPKGASHITRTGPEGCEFIAGFME